MAKTKDESESAGGSAERKTRRPRFGEMPDDLSAFGGEQTQEGYAQGWVKTEDIPGLVAAIGIPDPEHVEFPMHKMVRRHGELWSIRIEPAATHKVQGQLQQAHHWVYKREQPERMTGAA